MTPEQRARIEIDGRLAAAGWLLQDRQKEFNPAASLGVAVRDYPTDSGPADYVLFVDRRPVAVVEAKRAEEGQKLTVHESQSLRYATSGIKWALEGAGLRFAYEATDGLTRFTDYRDDDARSREVFSFHRPETMRGWLSQETTLRNRLKSFPAFDDRGFRACQTKAILKLEESFGGNKPRALIQMATGAGKTHAAITTIYRLLKFAKARRVLFLVDTRNLGAQADSDFRGYTPSDDRRLFTELYDVHRLTSSAIPSSAQVCISTIQRMYSILRGEALDESDEDENPDERRPTGRPKEVQYNAKYPPEFFDFVIIDECHRSIYNIWQQVLDYFDAFQVGLTATPDARTFGYFRENVVSEYSHEEAVLDNVNVGFDTYLIETAITRGGATIFKQWVEKRERLSRKQRWEMLDEDESYTGKELDRDVVNKSQIRLVARTFKEKLFAEIFPGRREVPKTIVFAKTDSHAEDIVQAIREEFNAGNDFCRKITFKADNPDTALRSFRNDYNPRIAVTVDMIATGTDVKPVECLLFMRDVRSRNYFEQMKGRGTRTLAEDDLKKVTPSANGNKPRFVIVDAVGVTQSLKADPRPFERRPSVSLKDLMDSVVMGARDEDTLTTLAGRLTRLDKQLTPAEQKRFVEVSGGPTISDVAKSLWNAHDEDHIEKTGRTSDELAEIAAAPFYDPKLRDFVETARRAHEQVIDNTNLDTLNAADWSQDNEAKAQEYIANFRRFIEDNKDEITALSIFYSGAWRTRPLTHRMIEEVHEAMQKAGITTEWLWRAYTVVRKDDVRAKSPINKLTDIVSLVRFELGHAAELRPYGAVVDANFQKWVFEKNAGHAHFTEEQMKWLRWVRDLVAESLAVTREDLELPPFVGSGGLGRFYELFGDGYEALLEEISLALGA